MNRRAADVAEHAAASCASRRGAADGQGALVVTATTCTERGTRRLMRQQMLAGGGAAASHGLCAQSAAGMGRSWLGRWRQRSGRLHACAGAARSAWSSRREHGARTLMVRSPCRELVWLELPGVRNPQKHGNLSICTLGPRRGRTGSRSTASQKLIFATGAASRARANPKSRWEPILGDRDEIHLPKCTVCIRSCKESLPGTALGMPSRLAGQICDRGV